MERVGNETAHGSARAWLIWAVAVVAYMVAVLNRSAFAATGRARGDLDLEVGTG